MACEWLEFSKVRTYSTSLTNLTRRFHMLEIKAPRPISLPHPIITYLSLYLSFFLSPPPPTPLSLSAIILALVLTTFPARYHTFSILLSLLDISSKVPSFVSPLPFSNSPHQRIDCHQTPSSSPSFVPFIPRLVTGDSIQRRSTKTSDKLLDVHASRRRHHECSNRQWR